jgi:phosphopentomutase/2,3-bisphosphoglycerate-independent phosphoglycerate mutase family metalloenzyme
MKSASCFVLRGPILLVAFLGIVAEGRAQVRRPAPANEARGTKHVVLVVIDGVRWQEVFRGGDCALMTKTEGGVEDTLLLRRRFCRTSTDSARTALLPFLWGEVARRGILIGDRDHGSDAHISNTMKFSYSGYNETVTGVADPHIDKNDFGPNPNVTVYEWLAHRRGFGGRVRVWGTWDVFDAIFNEERSEVPVRSGWETPFPRARDAAETELNALWATTTRHWDYMPPDAFLQRAVLRSLRTDRPRVLFVGFGEPDEWAHDRRYDNYLGSLHAADGYLKELWETLQSLPTYRGRTTLLIVTDHGRGRTAEKWTDHGREVDGAEEIWFGALGAGVPAAGPVQGGPPMIQAQVAATLASLVGERWSTFNTSAAPSVDFTLYLPSASTLERR